jgi:sugar phosphate permease
MSSRLRPHLAWVVLGICFFDLFVNYSVRLGFGLVLPEMIRTLQLSRSDGGSIYNAYLFTYISISPLTGYLTDRWGARWVISFSLGLVGSGALLLGAAHEIWALSLFFGLAGLGSTGIWVPIITLIQRWFAPQRRGLALGVLSTGYGLGFAALGAVFPWVVGALSWRYAWYFMGAAAVLLVLPNAVCLRSDPAESGLKPWGKESPTGPGNASGPPEGRVPLGRILKERNFWFIGLSYFAIAYGLYGVTTFMVDYAANQLHLPLEKASLLATIHGLLQVAGVLTVMPASDYLGRKRTILISNAVILCVLAGILVTSGWTVLCVLIGVLAAFYGATFPIYGAMAGDYFPREAIGTVAGAWTPFYGLGAILTHWVTGALRDATGVYGHGFGICTAMVAAGLVLMAFVRKRA